MHSRLEVIVDKGRGRVAMGYQRIAQRNDAGGGSVEHQQSASADAGCWSFKLGLGGLFQMLKNGRTDKNKMGIKFFRVIVG